MYCVLMFRNVSGIIECPTEARFGGLARDLTVFGISRIVVSEKVAPEQVRYWFYPRRLDNTTYINHTVVVDDVARDLVLYFGEKQTDFGIRVTDAKCYQRLVRVFQEATVNEVVPVEGGERVTLFGEVLMVDREISKRWLFGGLGLGLGLGLGVSGFGWVLPLGSPALPIWG